MKKRLTLRQAMVLHRKMWKIMMVASPAIKDIVCNSIIKEQRRSKITSAFNNCFLCQYAMQELALLTKSLDEPICNCCPVDWQPEVDAFPDCASSEAFPYTLWSKTTNEDEADRAEFASLIRGMVPKKWNYGRYSW